MQFFVSDIRAHKSLSQIFVEDAIKILGTPPDFTTYKEPVRFEAKAELVSGQVLVTGMYSINVTSTCSRCLENFDQKISGKIQEQFEILDDNGVIDTKEEVKENILLDIPLIAVCKKDCKGLCPRCGTNLNKNSCECAKQAVNPAWDVLSTIKFNKEKGSI